VVAAETVALGGGGGVLHVLVVIQGLVVTLDVLCAVERIAQGVCAGGRGTGGQEGS
jgi:hypothetical protein